MTNSNISEGDGSPVIGPLIISESEINNTNINLPVTTVEITSSIINYNEANGIILGNGLIQCSQITGNNSGTAIKSTGYYGYNIGGHVAIKNTTLRNNYYDDINNGIVDFSNYLSDTYYSQNCSYLPTSIDNKYEDKEKSVLDFSIFPNPTCDIINFEFANNSVQRILFFDITGKQIIEKTQIQQNETIDLSSFESGIYIIKIQTDNEIFTTKIVNE